MLTQKYYFENIFFLINTKKFSSLKILNVNFICLTFLKRAWTLWSISIKSWRNQSSMHNYNYFLYDNFLWWCNNNKTIFHMSQLINSSGSFSMLRIGTLEHLSYSLSMLYFVLFISISYIERTHTGSIWRKPGKYLDLVLLKIMRIPHLLNLFAYLWKKHQYIYFNQRFLKAQKWHSYF